jgi:hypothetical protein
MRAPIQQRRPAHPAAVATTTGGTVTTAAQSPAPATVSFEADIRPIFAPYQERMAWRFDLTSYEAVLANAATIYGRINGGGMPPPPFDPLTAEQIALFQQWMTDGCAP